MDLELISCAEDADTFVVDSFAGRCKREETWRQHSFDFLLRGYYASPLGTRVDVIFFSCVTTGS